MACYCTAARASVRPPLGSKTCKVGPGLLCSYAGVSPEKGDVSMLVTTDAPEFSLQPNRARQRSGVSSSNGGFGGGGGAEG